MPNTTPIRHSNTSLFTPAQTGCPVKDHLDHGSKLGLHRLDFEAYLVLGERVYRSVEADGQAADERQAWVATQAFYERTFAQAPKTEQSLGQEFLALLNQLLAETDAQYKREVASHYYQQVLNGVGGRMKVLLAICAELKTLVNAIMPASDDHKANFDALAQLLTGQIEEDLAYRMVAALLAITKDASDERREGMIVNALTAIKQAKTPEAHIQKLEAWAENEAGVEPLEENAPLSARSQSGCPNFDREVMAKQRLIPHRTRTNYNDEFYFDRYVTSLIEEQAFEQLQVAQAQRGLWDDQVPGNQAFEFAGHLAEFDETELPIGLLTLRTDAAKWYCFTQPAWLPWNREEASVAIQAYANAQGLTTRETCDLQSTCPNSWRGIQWTKDETLQAVFRWAEAQQIKMTLSLAQISRRLTTLLNRYYAPEDHVENVIEEGLVIERSERAERIAQQTATLMSELHADKHLTWMRNNPTYRELYVALAKAPTIGDVHLAITRAYAITQEGKQNPAQRQLSVAQLTALTTRKELTVERIKRNPSAPARALLARVERFAVGSKLEDASFLSQMNALPLHEQDAVIAKLRAKQIRVAASESCQSLLAEIKGAQEVKAANGKGNWLKGLRWACYEKNTPHTQYLQGVQARYQALPRHEQTAVWNRLNA